MLKTYLQETYNDAVIHKETNILAASSGVSVIPKLAGIHPLNSSFCGNGNIGTLPRRKRRGNLLIKAIKVKKG
ncbi:MAG: hypothetical protein M1381_01065 [Deltaproteobacteria bacterium]|nr:hypothetical protein [Deltaproteobacteria bacterium]MCL5792166.1 hypothetical protein [Deltaproteobacteria bacterium]